MLFVTRILLVFLVITTVFMAPSGARALTSDSLSENLERIDKEYGVSLNTLKKANEILHALVFPGQTEEAAKGDTHYTVQAGDTLFGIGQRFNVDYRQIMQINGLTKTEICPGMSLQIPAVPSKSLTAHEPPKVSRGGSFRRPTPEEVDILARIITAEAEGELYEGKVAVGAVVLNRVESPNFPDSIHDVIYQRRDGKYQFQPVKNGRVNGPASSQSVEAAMDAFKGHDPTDGALYFFATYVKNKWLRARPVSKIIGNHVFTY